VHNSIQAWLERFPALCVTLALLGLQTSCESIIGLEDRTLVKDGGTGVSVTASPLCKGYCTDVNKNCKAPRLDAYKSDEDCQAMCSFLPPGKDDASETKGNTVSCRAHYAKEAASLERDVMTCPAAAPGGGSPGISPSCGDNCAGFCGMSAQICPENPQKDCVEKCRALPDNGGYSAENDYLGGDTIQCRIAHLNAAAQAKKGNMDVERKDHCMHALLRAALSDRPFCDLPPDSEPNCKDYCKIVQQACTENPVYGSQGECEKFCDSAFVKGKNTLPMMPNMQDSTTDTLACRRWHAYFAFDVDPVTHCSHAGPTGNGHCGKICPAYCAELKRGCATQFNAKYKGDTAAMLCETDCRAVRGAKDEELGYNVMSEEFKTDSLQCRFGYLVDAFNGKDTCDKAMPQGTCSR
jgi:hypothetical protein